MELYVSRNTANSLVFLRFRKKLELLGTSWDYRRADVRSAIYFKALFYLEKGLVAYPKMPSFYPNVLPQGALTQSHRGPKAPAISLLYPVTYIKVPF